MKLDPGDYNLLGLKLHENVYIDICLPFRSHHRKQILQCLSNAVRDFMRHDSYAILNYVDDFIGVGIPSIVHYSYSHLLCLLYAFGLDISERKLV